MTTYSEPNPPSRKSGDFPNTNTIPDGWVMDELMETYNTTGSVNDRGTVSAQPVMEPKEAVPVPATGYLNGRSNGKAHHQEPSEQTGSPTESPFARQLNPFPSGADLTGMWL